MKNINVKKRLPRKTKAFVATFNAGEKIGLELIPKKKGGVIIKNVLENTPAKRQGLSKGMSLLKIDDVIVDTIAKENSKNTTSTLIQEVVQTIHQILKSKSSVRLFFTKPTYRKTRIIKNDYPQDAR